MRIYTALVVATLVAFVPTPSMAEPQRGPAGGEGKGKNKDAASKEGAKKEGAGGNKEGAGGNKEGASKAK